VDDAGEAPQYGTIVLAAGSSSRMGAHKLLLPLGGQPLVAYAVTAACASMAEPVVVVLGRAAEDVRAALPTGRYATVVNPDYVAGMAGSLRAGLHTLREVTGGNVAGVLIALADQPLAGADLFDALLRAAAASPDRIIAASFGGRRGNPVVFPATLFGELERVEGDAGGRGLIARHSDLLRLVEWPYLRAALDVDRPSDYEQVVSLLASGPSSSADG
jgi:molybdenum cofactor cytidylyltransferase